MNVAKVNAFDAAIVPPRGKAEVTRYLDAAVRALGGRSDSALARTMGVAPSTLASWKARGAIPDEQVSWFTSTLIPKVAEYRSDLPQASNTARAAAVALIARTSGNPAQVPRFQILATAKLLGPILAIAELLVELEGLDPRLLDSNTVERVADLLEGSMLRLRSTLGPGFFG